MTSFFDPSKLEKESIFRGLCNAQKYFKGRILDLGCGDQPYARLAGRGNLEYIGVDRSLEHSPLPDVCADSLKLPFRDSSFDTILSTQVIEHVSDPSEMMREISRVLKPCGHVIMTAPQAWPLHEEPRDFFRYTRYGLQILAQRHALEIVYIHERGGGVLALAQLANAMLHDKFAGHSLLRFFLKLIVSPILSFFKLLDKMLYYPKFTLGYIMTAQKRGSR
jgi:SAM-dependent methyltransferase